MLVQRNRDGTGVQPRLRERGGGRNVSSLFNGNIHAGSVWLYCGIVRGFGVCVETL